MAKRKVAVKTPAGPSAETVRAQADQTLALMGVTREEFRARVIEQAVQGLTGQYADPGEYRYMQSAIEEATQKAVSAAVDAYCAKHITPIARKFVTEMKFPNTNRYGEPKGEPETLLEYTARVAHGWLEEMVDSDGRSKREGASYGITTARGVYLVHKYLNHEINQKLTSAVAQANKAIANGIEASIKQALADVLAKLRVEASTR